MASQSREQCNKSSQLIRNSRVVGYPPSMRGWVTHALSIYGSAGPRGWVSDGSAVLGGSSLQLNRETTAYITKADQGGLQLRSGPRYTARDTTGG